jgi:hypothetical protein
MSKLSPERWAFDITRLLNAVLGDNRFPVNVPDVAMEISKAKCPDDPIAFVRGADLPGFDGALYPAPAGKKGWGIIYNNRITSEGRINFTLAHEFGHYLLHRMRNPNGFNCGQQDVVRWDSEYGQIEHQANVFAATLLMPLDDFRRQIDPKMDAGIEQLSACADRYRVSLVASALRWLQYTDRRAVLVVSRDGYILWARSSERALRTRAFFRTSGPPIAVPPQSLAATRSDTREEVQHPSGVWFPAETREAVVRSEQYDFTVSLLTLADDNRVWHPDAEPDEDTFDRFKPSQAI